jgi:tetratricopeptide (TPR) repeat protein
LVLPQDERGQVYIAAPDLWAVRSFTAELPAPVGAPKVAEIPPTVELAAVLGSPSGPAEQEWTRLVERTAEPARLDPRDGFEAFESAMGRSDLTAAKAVADQTLDIARQRRAARGDTQQALRDLTISLDNVGQVERDFGNLDAARSAYRESLEIARRLREAVGDTPQALRDLSISLNNVGQVEGGLGNLEAARSAYREGLELRRQVREAVGDTPEHRESLELCRQLREAVGDTPQALRDLSVSLDNVGRVEHDFGNLEGARSAYREGLELRRQLREAVGDTPQALRDLSISLENVGRVERDLGNLEGPQRLSREPGALPPAARGGRRHAAGAARSVGLA